MKEIRTINNQIIEDIRELLLLSRQKLQQSVNSVMVQTYWNIGKIIVEDEQAGENRAEYGTQQLEQISNNLSKEFGKGFDARNLRNMRQFYTVFPIWHSVNAKLSWTHYKRLVRVENSEARTWYIEESISNNWSVRALDRQISKLYYERLLASKEKLPVIEEAKEKTDILQINPKDVLRDPYIFDFLNLPNQSLPEAVAKYSVLSDSKQLFSSKYLPFLPTEEELRIELLRERELLL